MSLKDKVVLVTGGSQGIGEAVCHALGAQGAAVAVVASSSIQKAEAVAARIRDAGGRARGYACDVRDEKQAARAVAAATQDFGRVDMLVNSAGVFLPTPAGETDRAVMDQMVDINLKGTWNMVNAVAPQLKAAGKGKIVNVASVAGLTGFGTFAVYCATKAGIIMLTRALACELGRLGINVNCVAPGNTATPMNEHIRNSADMAGMRDFMASRTPSGRTFSPPEEIAGGVLFLLSDAANAMHGSCLLMDEGISAGI